MKIIRSGAYETLYDMPLVVQWYLTMHCNYRCSYCLARKLFRDDWPFSTLAQLRVAVDNLAALNRPWYDIILVGGEPTIHPHILELMRMLQETLQERLNNTHIITNGSRNKSFYEKVLQLAKSTNVGLLISIHTEYVNMPHILELIELLSRDVNLCFALMFNPAKGEEVRLIYDILFEYRKMFPFHVNIDMIAVLGGSFDPRYTQEDFEWQKTATVKFRALENALSSKIPSVNKYKYSYRSFYDVEKDGERKIIESNDTVFIRQNGLSNREGMYCLANTGVLNIQEDGRCNGMVCSADQVEYNIYKENVFDPSFVSESLIHCVKCPFSVCPCSVNDYIPKFSSYEEAVRFIEVFRNKQNVLFDAFRLNFNTDFDGV